jgi:glycosyltransferase involved in cell wall biosynthesis
VIRAAAVVVPVHDEEATLPACLAALSVAAAHAPVPVTPVVVLDSCRDASAAISAGAGVSTVTIDAANVGRARQAGVTAALAAIALPPDQVWVATTDADSVVPHSWLADQVAAADLGADAHVGTIELAGEGIARSLHRRFSDQYRRWADAGGQRHPHVHGANLGVRASVYAAVGGFPALASHEDRILVERLEAHPGLVVRRSAALPVVTSSRARGRAPAGLAADLLRLGSGRAGTRPAPVPAGGPITTTPGDPVAASGTGG